MITTTMWDYELRLRSFRLLAEAFGLAELTEQTAPSPPPPRSESEAWPIVPNEPATSPFMGERDGRSRLCSAARGAA